MCVCECVCVHVCVDMCMCLRVYECVCTCMCACVCMNACVHVCAEWYCTQDAERARNTCTCLHPYQPFASLQIIIGLLQLSYVLLHVLLQGQLLCPLLLQRRYGDVALMLLGLQLCLSEEHRDI